MFIPKRLVIDCIQVFTNHCSKCINASAERTRIKADNTYRSGFEVASCCLCLHVLSDYSKEQWKELALRFNFKLYDALLPEGYLDKVEKKIKKCRICGSEAIENGLCEECNEWTSNR